MNYSKRTALFSECGKFRYELFREWHYNKPIAMCIGLNPSKADDEKDDATIRILTKQLDKLGFGALRMCNLYAFIATKPAGLLAAIDKLGDNNAILQNAARHSHEIIYCWGAWPFISVRVKQVRAMLPEGKCFAKTKDGHPLHPMAIMWQGLDITELKQF